MSKPKTNPMKVRKEGMTFLIERQAQDCAPLQFLREFTQNGIEAAA